MQSQFFPVLSSSRVLESFRIEEELCYWIRELVKVYNGALRLSSVSQSFPVEEMLFMEIKSLRKMGSVVNLLSRSLPSACEVRLGNSVGSV